MRASDFYESYVVTVASNPAKESGCTSSVATVVRHSTKEPGLMITQNQIPKQKRKQNWRA